MKYGTRYTFIYLRGIECKVEDSTDELMNEAVTIVDSHTFYDYFETKEDAIDSLSDVDSEIIDNLLLVEKIVAV